MKKNPQPNLKLLANILFDILVVNMAYLGAMWIRFDFHYSAIPYALSMRILPMAPIFTLIAMIIFWAFRLYSSIWAYVGVSEFIRIILASMIYVAAHYFLSFFFFPNIWMPRGYFVIEFFMLAAGLCLVRFFYRFYLIAERKMNKSEEADHSIRTMIIGAGESGRAIIHEMNVSDKIDNNVVALIDDDPEKQGKYLENVKVYGGQESIVPVAEKLGVQEIILAMPSASRKAQQEILEQCKKTNCKLKILPGMYQIISGEVNVSKIRDVDLEDLLGRDPVEVNSSEISEYIEGKTVLVTGGGGTIGSELSRQIASFKPKRLIIFDIYENNAYNLQMALERQYPDLDLKVLIGSVRNIERLRSIFAEERPDIVYHAAAHKHVPLMEVSPNEAVKNNVFGTLNVVKAADEFGVSRFVLISTDKAVNPTSVMGATKRICEMIIQSYNERSNTDYVAVRFGNVLGSSGSVVPLFRSQIAAGGPVTVTHPDIVRYFMTISEAVSLVLQAGAYAKGGEIFILEMGKPVKILDLARNLIRLSGLKEGEDIDISFTGLRPGEKLYEEVLMNEEGLQTTPNQRIKIGHPIEFDIDEFYQKLPGLKKAADEETNQIRDSISELVPTFQVSIDGIPTQYKSFKKEYGSVTNKEGQQILHREELEEES